MHANGDLLKRHLEGLGVTVDDPVEIQHGYQLVVRNGAQRVVVDVYQKTGRCVPKGPVGDLLTLTQDACTAVNDGLPLPPVTSDNEINKVIEDLVAAGVEETVVRYVAEAAEATKRDLVIAAMFLIGGASERMIYLLIEALLASIGDETERRAAASGKLTGGPMLDRLQHLHDRITKVERQIPIEMKYEWDNNLHMLADFYRRTRNSVGHPVTPPKLSAQDARLAMVAAKGYFLGLHRLTDFLLTHKLTYPIPGKS